MFDNKFNTARRQVLRVGGAVVGTGVIPMTASARPENEYVGIEYNPRTKEIIGEIDARLVQTQETLKGSLHLSDETIPLNQNSSKRFTTPDDNHKVDQFSFTKGKDKKRKKDFRKNGKNMQVDIRTVSSGNITGSLSHMTGSKKKAFKIQPRNKKDSDKNIIAKLKNDIKRGEKDE